MFGVPFQNEKRWQTQSLDEICTYLTDGSHYSPKEDTNGIYPMLTVKDMTERGFDYGDCKLIGEEEYAKMVANGCVPKVGDVLVAKDGSYFKTAFVIEDEREQAVLSSIAILRPDKAKMVPRFMREYLMSGQVLKAVESEYITGTAIKRVILKKLKTMPIYIPPISMQEKYVALVEQSDKSKFETNSKGLNQCNMEDICEGITDGSHTPPKGIDYSEYLMLSSKNIINDCITVDEPRYLSEEQFESENKRTRIKAGDVLLTIVGTVGRTAVVPEEHPNMTLQRSVCVLHPKKDVILSKFLFYELKCMQGYIDSLAQGAAQRGIYLGQVAKLQVVVPPIENQKRFVSFLEQSDKSKYICNVTRRFLC